MSEARSVEDLSREIDRQRTELAAAVATVRHDLRGIVLEQVPKLGAAAAIVLLALVAGRLNRRRRRTREPVERFRLGRFAVVEHD